MQAAQPGDVRNGFDIEDENGIHGVSSSRQRPTFYRFQ